MNEIPMRSEMKKCIFLRTATLFLTLFLCGQGRSFAAEDLDLATNCGVRSVVNLASFLGKDVTHQQFTTLCEKFPAAEVSMLDVMDAADLVHIPLEGKEISPDELQAHPMPAIAALQGHFMMLDRVTDHWVRVFEDGVPILMPRKEFESRYTGKALVVDESRQSAQGVLNVDRPIIDLGKIPLNTRTMKVTVTLTNTGKKPVEIEKIVPTCTCTVPSLSVHSIAPGQRVPLNITVSMPGWGSLNAGLYLESSGERAITYVSVVGAIENDIVFEPKRLYFGDIPSGHEARKLIKIHDKERKLSLPLVVSSSSGQIHATWSPLDPNTSLLTVVIDDTKLVGSIDESLTVSENDGQRHFDIPIQGTVASELQAQPNHLVFGNDESNSKTPSEIHVWNREGKNFDIASISSPPNVEVKKLVSGAGGFALQVNIRQNSESPHGQEAIVVHPQNSKLGDLSIPVLLMGEEKYLPGAAEAALLPKAEDDHETPMGSPLPPMKIGDAAPNFTVSDDNGTVWHLSDLRGKKSVLLTFFPKCFTGGCANHLSGLRDHQREFDATNVQILAVSVDPATGEKGQKAFADQWKFTFPMIPDTARVLSNLYGATQNPDERDARMTFLIDKQGFVRYIDTDVHVQTHGADMLAKIHELGMDK